MASNYTRRVFGDSNQKNLIITVRVSKFEGSYSKGRTCQTQYWSRPQKIFAKDLCVNCGWVWPGEKWMKRWHCSQKSRQCSTAAYRASYVSISDSLQVKSRSPIVSFFLLAFPFSFSCFFLFSFSRKYYRQGQGLAAGVSVFRATTWHALTRHQVIS